MHLEVHVWIVLAVCAFIAGFSKTAVPGASILAVPLLAAVMPAKASVGTMLGMFYISDVFAAAYYRPHAEWSHLARLLPAIALGVLGGALGVSALAGAQLERAIGVIVLIMLAMSFFRAERVGEKVQRVRWRVAAVVGFFVGFTSMMANAAGPVLSLYFVLTRLPKVEFVSTYAWISLAMNSIKIPFSLSLGMMTVETIKLNLLMCPFVVLGLVIGIYVLRKIPQKIFVNTILVLATVAGIKLLF